MELDRLARALTLGVGIAAAPLPLTAQETQAEDLSQPTTVDVPYECVEGTPVEDAFEGGEIELNFLPTPQDPDSYTLRMMPSFDSPKRGEGQTQYTFIVSGDMPDPSKLSGEEGGPVVLKYLKQGPGVYNSVARPDSLGDGPLSNRFRTVDEIVGNLEECYRQKNIGDL